MDAATNETRLIIVPGPQPPTSDANLLNLLNLLNLSNLSNLSNL
jgi:hypothetical protein